MEFLQYILYAWAGWYLMGKWQEHRAETARLRKELAKRSSSE